MVLLHCRTVSSLRVHTSHYPWSSVNLALALQVWRETTSRIKTYNMIMKFQRGFRIILFINDIPGAALTKKLHNDIRQVLVLPLCWTRATKLISTGHIYHKVIFIVSVSIVDIYICVYVRAFLLSSSSLWLLKRAIRLLQDYPILLKQFLEHLLLLHLAHWCLILIPRAMMTKSPNRRISSHLNNTLK